MDDKKEKRMKVKNSGNRRKLEPKWLITIVTVTFFLSAAINFVSGRILASVPLMPGILVLGFIILVGILFDILGLAVATASEIPFHSMASNRVKGAGVAIMLIRNAEKVSSFCNDVVGDIAGIISGTIAASISAALILRYPSADAVVISILLTAFVAALTICGKAIGKTIAMNNSNTLVFYMGKILSFFGMKDGRKK